MSTKQRQSLSLDLDALFPGEDISFGETTIVIRPLSIQQIAILSKKIKGFGSTLSALDVTWENYSTPGGIFKISSVILENFPDILEEAANVAIEDLQVLPIEAIVKIVEKIIAVNMKSKEELEKNFKSLTEKFIPEENPKAQATKNRKKR